MQTAGETSINKVNIIGLFVFAIAVTFRNKNEKKKQAATVDNFTTFSKNKSRLKHCCYAIELICLNYACVLL